MIVKCLEYNQLMHNHIYNYIINYNKPVSRFFFLIIFFNFVNNIIHVLYAYREYNDI